MIHFLTIGIILGLSAGFSPGPLLTLVISETLEHDMKAGIKVALAPIVTDLPIIILTVFILAKLTNFHNILGIISLSGGFLILFMGYKGIRTKGIEFKLEKDRPKSLIKGIVVNALSPHPYLFWFSVGGPILTRAMKVSAVAVLAFIGGFYILLIGSKLILSIVVGRSRSFLNGTLYLYILRLLGMVLGLIALLLFRDGLKLLGLIGV